MPGVLNGRRVCSKCGIEYDTPEKWFHKRSMSKDGFRPWCKKCVSLYGKQRRGTLNKIEAEEGYKICGKCKNQLPANSIYFNKDKTRPSGSTYFCRGCISTYRKGYNITSKEIRKVKTKQYRDKHKEHIRKVGRVHYGKLALYTSYNASLLLFEETKCDEQGYLLVQCAYCGNYFNPTNAQCRNRIKSFNGKNEGDGRFYCSSGCKQSCPIFNQKKWPKGFKVSSSREVHPLLRQLALARDNYKCQKCGKLIDEIALHVHHIDGATEQPLLSNDLTNVITYCKLCHEKIHSKEGCTYYDYKCKK